MNPFIAQIIMFGGNFAPRGWALCDGQLLPINQNDALFSILGTTYGGDGRTTFALPDLRGRAPVHAGSGPGLTTIPLGSKGGAEQVVLGINQLPSHNHDASGLTAALGSNEEDGDSDEATGRNFGIASAGTPYNSQANDNSMGAGGSSVTIGGNTGSQGGGQAVGIRNPYAAVNYIIALQGVYPSRS